MSLLDTELITERCRELGVSAITLARVLGVSTVAIRSLEQGTNHGHLTLHKLKLLADAIGIPPAAFFTVDDPGANGPATKPELKIEAALALIGKKIDPEDLATALRCTLGEVHAACKSLRERRAHCALRPYYNGGQWGLTVDRTLLSAQEVEDLERACMTRSRINVNEAALLKRITDSRDGFRDDQCSYAERPLLARFLRLGWIERRNSRYHPTTELLISLGLLPAGPAQSLSPAEALEANLATRRRPPTRPTTGPRVRNKKPPQRKHQSTARRQA